MSSSEPPKLRALRCVYADNAGLRRCRVLPLLQQNSVTLPHIGLTTGCMGQGVHVDVVLPDSGLSATGEAVLTPDVDSYVEQLPWWPAHGMANCDLLDKSGARRWVGLMGGCRDFAVHAHGWLCMLPRNPLPPIHVNPHQASRGRAARAPPSSAASAPSRRRTGWSSRRGSRWSSSS